MRNRKSHHNEIISDDRALCASVYKYIDLRLFNFILAS